MPYIDVIIAIIIAYLFGSISSAILVCKVMGLPDPRTQGSRNPGATNVLRIGGKTPAIITLMGDILKGFIPVIAAKWYGFDDLSLSLVALAAFMGHLFPIYFKFHGGKGVATLFGCIFGLSWLVGVELAASWLIVAVIFRYSSLASLVVAVLAPFYMWYFDNLDFALATGIMSILLIIRHRANIRKLFIGKEKKIGEKA